MRRVLAGLTLLASACKPSGGDTVLVSETVDIPPGKFVFYDLYTDHDCEFEFFVTPEGPGVEYWAGCGPGGFAVVDENPSEDKQQAAAGMTSTLKGSFAIGKVHASALNRGVASVKVKCRLVTRLPKKN